MADTSLSTEMAMMKIKDCMANQHPAVRSDPSSDPTKQLLGMPDEIRLEIYRAFLVKDGNVKLKCDYQPDAIRWTKSLSVNKGVTAFLRTCKQIKIEGTDILYGDNTFECYHVRVFKNEFIGGQSFKHSDKLRGIGKENASKIKRGLFGLPLVIIRSLQDSQECKPFLDFMCTDLVELQKLSITTMILSRAGMEAEHDQASRTRALKWASNGTFTQGAWTQQPKIAELSELEGWWSKLGGKGNAEGASADV